MRILISTIPKLGYFMVDTYFNIKKENRTQIDSNSFFLNNQECRDLKYQYRFRENYNPKRCTKFKAIYREQGNAYLILDTIEGIIFLLAEKDIEQIIIETSFRSPYNLHNITNMSIKSRDYYESFIR